MNLTTEPEIVDWPQSHLVFVEKAGAFSSTAPQAWQELHRLKAAIAKHNRITGAIALYKPGPKNLPRGISGRRRGPGVARWRSIHAI